MPDNGPTGDITAPATQETVNPAQVSSPVPPTVPPTPPNAPSDPENRISALMSRADKAQRAYEQAVAERLRAQQELEAERTQRQQIAQAAAQTTEQYLNKQRELEEQIRKERAESTKMRLLFPHPELAEYAALIPVSEDENTVKNAIAVALQARQNDITRALQQQQQQTPPPAPIPAPQAPPAYPPNTFVPPMQPARPAADAASQAMTPQDIEAKLKQANREFRQNPTPENHAAFERVRDEMVKVAEQMVRRGQ